MKGYDGYTTMTFARERRVLTVTFNRPAVLNAVSAAMHSEMARLFYDIAADRETDIVVLTGAGRAFCAGGDMDWLQSAVDDISVFDQIAVEAKRIVFGLLDLEKPVICRLNGDAVGLGATVALFCDIIIAADDARIGDLHVNIGLSAGDGGAIIWPQLIGYPRAKEFLMTGRLIDGAEAAALGSRERGGAGRRARCPRRADGRQAGAGRDPGDPLHQGLDQHRPQTARARDDGCLHRLRKPDQRLRRPSRRARGLPRAPQARVRPQPGALMRRAAAAKTDAGALPGWDLSDLYPGPRSDEVRRDLEQAAAAAEALHEEFAGRVGDLNGETLADLIARYEAIKETLERLTSYAYLVYCTAMDDAETAQFFQTVREETTATESRLLFLTLELNRIEDDALEDKLKAPALARYAPWVRDVRAFRPFQLSDEVERLLLEKQVAGRAAWMRLFDETMAALRFSVRGEALGSAEALNLLSDKDGEVRKEAAQALGTVLGENVRTFALITNTLAKDKEIEDQWRGFERPISARNLGNRVEDEVVDALIAAVEAAAPRLAHRYYALKARWMGVDRLDYWDRNAPLPEDDDRTVGWDEAISTVLAAYRAFSPELAGIGRRFFDNDWIDVPVRNGKSPGAFAHPTVPGAHPYLLLNYQGKARDVMVLAHELGHGVHQVLAGRQGLLMAETPLTLAETASVFGEQLTFRTLLDGESEPERRRVMLAGKVEDMLNTVVRQVAFCAFERRVHEERRAGELTPERLSEHWLAVQSESLGPALRFHDEYRFYWAYIPHFIHAPFYVYAYAFGECLVNALYAVYRAEPAGFEQKYLDMLRAGGSLRYRELLAPFGLDASEPAFWSRGLDVIAGFVDELEAAL